MRTGTFALRDRSMSFEDFKAVVHRWDRIDKLYGLQTIAADRAPASAKMKDWSFEERQTLLPFAAVQHHGQLLGYNGLNTDAPGTAVLAHSGSAASVYSITSSARSSIEVGISRPSTLAAFRFTISSNFVGCSTGRSAGFAPFKILSKKTAERR